MLTHSAYPLMQGVSPLFWQSPMQEDSALLIRWIVRRLVLGDHQLKQVNKVRRRHSACSLIRRDFAVATESEERTSYTVIPEHFIPVVPFLFGIFNLDEPQSSMTCVCEYQAYPLFVKRDRSARISLLSGHLLSALVWQLA
jgi:hypothetical protein